MASAVRRTLLLTCTALLFSLSALTLQAQDAMVHDASALVPPAGSHVAIVEFADMECPTCARDNPILKQAAAQYKIPWVRHDFLISYHAWSKQAALFARWFDASSKGKALGDEYRDQVFANQSSIYNLNVLNRFTQDFARSHGLTLPFSMDPKLEGAVMADHNLGLRTGVTGTPSVWIVTDRGKGSRYTLVAVDMHNLYQVIDQALADTRGAAPAAAKKPVARK
jgi:protein-disulfide isomerase